MRAVKWLNGHLGPAWARRFVLRLALVGVVTCLGVAAWADASDTVGGSSLGSLYCKLTGGADCVISATALTGQEAVQSWTASDNAFSTKMQVRNGSAASSQFCGNLVADCDTTSYASLALEGMTAAGGDTGTLPLVRISGARESAYGSLVANAALTTRPVLGLYNYTTELAEVSATGGWRNPSANQCGALNAGDWCFEDGVTLATGGTALVTMKAGTTAAYAGNYFTDSAGSVVGQFLYAGSAIADTDLANKVCLSGIGKTVAFMRSDDVAAGTDAFEFRDNTAATGVQLATIDGTGNLFLNASATRSKGTCTLNGASPSTCTATVAANSICTCSLRGATAAIAAKGCATGLAATTLTITSANAATDVATYHCF